MLGEHDAEAARTELADLESRLRLVELLEAYDLLWRATSDPACLRRAKEALDELVAHAPEAYRGSMVESVPLYREVEGAWAAHGGEG